MKGRKANANFFKQGGGDDTGNDIVIAAPKRGQNQGGSAVVTSGGGGPITAKALEAALKRAQQNGTLSLQGRELTAFPAEIINF